MQNSVKPLGNRPCPAAEKILGHISSLSKRSRACNTELQVGVLRVGSFPSPVRAMRGSTEFFEKDLVHKVHRINGQRPDRSLLSSICLFLIFLNF